MPFRTLADQLRRLGYSETGESQDDTPIPDLSPDIPEEELFRQAVGPVRRLPAGSGRALALPPRREYRFADSDDDAMRALEDLCRNGDVSLRARREYVEETKSADVYVRPDGLMYVGYRNGRSR